MYLYSTNYLYLVASALLCPVRFHCITLIHLNPEAFNASFEVAAQGSYTP
jgi:hypothetical protein